ncbi:response regulator [Deltaproteobacteria bacterium TL4]
MDIMSFNRNILIVDDEESIREAYKTILEPKTQRSSRRVAKKGSSEEYQLFFAECGERGVEIYKEQLEKGDPIAMGFFDMIMPGGIDGGETIRQIRAIHPSIMCVVVTAYADRDPKEIREFFDDQSMWLYLNKPFNDGEIRQLALSNTHSWNLRKQNKDYQENLEGLVKLRTEELNAELEKVAIIQRDLLPHKFPKHSCLAISTYYETCLELGGGWRLL